MATNPFQMGLQTFAQMANIAEQGRQSRLQQEQIESAKAAQTAQAEKERMIQGLAQQYNETQDPALMRQIITLDTDAAKAMQQQFGILDEATKTQAVNKASALANMLKQNPEQAIQFWNENLAQDPAFTGLKDNFDAGDVKGALNEIGYGLTIAGGTEAYDSVFAPIERTNFAKDLIEAGVQPGSEEFKSAVLNKYGKGKTVSYDVKEGVNPDTGKTEYFQVSRTDPGDKNWLGVDVPESQKSIENRKKEIDAMKSEKKTLTDTIATVDQIINSPGLGGVAGLDAFRRFVPGTEAANTQSYIDRLQSQNFLTAVSEMKGMGALSNAEGQKLSTAVAALSPRMSDDAFKAELERIKTQLAVALERIETNNLIDNANPSQQSDAVTISWSDL